MKAELPTCRNCGGEPQWMRRDESSCGGWSTDRLLWLQCPCGMRTVSHDISYNEDKHRAELIAIFAGNPPAPATLCARLIARHGA